MNERIILGLTGFSGTGKTKLADYLSSEHDFTLFEGSTWLRRTAEEVGLTLSSRSDYEQFFRCQQGVYGLSWLSDVMLAHDAKRLLQVGLRSPHDLRNVQRVGGKVIGLLCPPATCLSRLDATNPKNSSTIEEYMQHQAIEESLYDVGSHTAWTVMHADYRLDTSKPIEATYAELDGIVSELTHQ